mmetsp:Transcript_3376/g.8447  ORF Transcript_3376/g.8447 Transcript_3376/m.8447 type:complete len:219 (-) Transcript_3376:480-1136(-)
MLASGWSWWSRCTSEVTPLLMLSHVLKKPLCTSHPSHLGNTDRFENCRLSIQFSRLDVPRKDTTISPEPNPTKAFICVEALVNVFAVKEGSAATHLEHVHEATVSKSQYAAPAKYANCSALLGSYAARARVAEGGSLAERLEGRAEGCCQPWTAEQSTPSAQSSGVWQRMARRKANNSGRRREGRGGGPVAAAAARAERGSERDRLTDRRTEEGCSRA